MEHISSRARLVSFIIVIGIFLGVTTFLLFFGNWNQYQSLGASPNIDFTGSNHYAWNDAIGWIDFDTGTIEVSSTRLTGYASSSIGEISLDCETTSGVPPPVNKCNGGATEYYVSNDGAGNLDGYAWNDAIGWISFCGSQCGNGAVGYQVTIDTGTGDFSGYAWNDVVGFISFNCDPDTNCVSGPDPDYKVKAFWSTNPTTGWLESATYDTGVSGGAQVNSILWHGVTNGGEVKFQMAFSSNSVGPWDFSGNTLDPISSTSLAVQPNVTLPVDYTLGQNQQYFRYRIFLYSDPARTVTPRVDDVIVNWSR
ncbi:MAG: hypothetical protein AAB691_01825 [Patescibacteria group bacterium]